MSVIDPQSIAIATSTFYPKWYRGKLRSIKHVDKVRGDLALEFLQKAKEKGYRVVMVDGKSSRTFREEIRKIEDIIVLQKRNPKRSPAKRKAINRARLLPGIKVIILSDLEKVSIVTDCVPLLVEPVLKGEADIVVAKRDSTLFKESYPFYMYESEIKGNKIYNEILRVHGLLNNSDEDLDMFFGPRAFRNDSKIVKLFMKQYKINITNSFIGSGYFDVEDYSNTLFFPVVRALKKRFRVQSITVPFVYGRTQKENEEKTAKEVFIKKRKVQHLSLLIDLLHFVNYL